METTIRGKRILTGPTTFRVSEAENERRIEGYFAVFGPVYDMGHGMTESVAPEAFADTLGDDIRALTNHDTSLVLGRTKANTLTLHTDGKGLWGSILINPEDQDAMNLYSRVKRGDVSQCSFGFDILDEERQIAENGNVHWTIKRVKLYEVSVVTFPAYEDTGVEARAQELKRDGLDPAQRRKEMEEAERQKKLSEWRERARRRYTHGS